MQGVTRKVAARFAERARMRFAGDGVADSVLGSIEIDEPTLSVAFDREWARALLRLAGERMREEATGRGPGAELRVELLRLRSAEGIPLREIAKRRGIHADAVHRAYAKARDEFRACLRRIVADHAVRSESELDEEIARVLALIR